MKRKEMIEYLKQNMPDFEGNEEEVEIKTALYIYVELGKRKSFDEKYYFGNSQTRRKIYSMAERGERDVEEIAEKRKIICVSLTHLYCSLLREFGIYAIASTPEEDGHINPIIVTKNKQAFVADLQRDLENIQTKSRLQHFEYRVDLTSSKEDKSNQEVITKMLTEMGYIDHENDYKDEEIKKLKEEVEGKNPHEALRIILEDEELYRGNEEMESIEINKFYKATFRRILPHFMEKRVFAFNCYRENEEKERDYTLCAFSEEDTIISYLFSKKDRRFLRIEIQKLKELEEKGLKFGARPKENGSNKLQKYINRQVHLERKEFK